MYFIVKARCGHVGRDKYIPIHFPIWANTAKDAAAIARNIPRVKHDHKDAVMSVKQVNWIAFEVQKVLNEFDPYLKVGSKYEQNAIMDLIADRIEYEDREQVFVPHKRDSVKYKLLKNSIRCAEMDNQIKLYC